AVHERASTDVAEHPRPRVSLLRLGRERAHLDEPKPECAKRPYEPRILVEPGGDAERGGEIEAERANAQRRIARLESPPHPRNPAEQAEAGCARTVRRFGIETAEDAFEDDAIEG